jgi:EAL domain-containing protein (putative c-di-GMP-specific phosphodiesterase class I)
MEAAVGIARYTEYGMTGKSLLRNADAALRQGIRLNQSVMLYSENITDQARRWLAIEQGLKNALANNEFSLNIQPKVDAQHGRFAGGEVLIRWQQDGQMIYPSEFIPVAEESGLIIKIGEWVLKEACMQWVRWHQQGLQAQRIAVNVSAQQFIQEDFVDVVAQTLETTGIPPAVLELEITEEVASQNPEKIIHTMQRLKRLGVRLAIDDFGTGYSSLGYLSRFPIDTLKIDRIFVSTMESNPHNAALVRMIISLAKELKLEVVAEGAENAAQADMLAQLGCDLIQGYYYFKPMAIADYQAVLTDELAIRTA